MSRVLLISVGILALFAQTPVASEEEAWDAELEQEPDAVSLMQTAQPGLSRVSFAGPPVGSLSDGDVDLLLAEDDTLPGEAPAAVPSPFVPAARKSRRGNEKAFLTIVAAGVAFCAICHFAGSAWGAKSSNKALAQAPPPAPEPARPRRSRARQEETDAFGCTRLHTAAHEGNRVEVRKLLEGKAFVDACEAWDETPLHMAAKMGHAEVCKLLIEHGASVNKVNADDKTPLFLAASASHEEACRVLLDNGAGAGGADDASLPPLLCALLVQRVATTH